MMNITGMMSITGTSGISRMDIRATIPCIILRAAGKFRMLARCDAASATELRLDASLSQRRATERMLRGQWRG
jgi:hypothetical protein